jgi:hypothetical protein
VGAAILGGLVVMILLNVAWIGLAPPGAGPFARRADVGFDALVRTDSRTIANYYTIYFDLDEVATEEPVTVFDQGVLDPFASLALLGHRPEVEDYDCAIGADTAGRLRNLPHREGVSWELLGGRDDRPYVVVTAGSGAVRAFCGPDAVYFVPGSVAQEVIS